MAFKKGYIPWNKNKKCPKCKPKTAFKKGHTKKIKQELNSKAAEK